MGLREVFSKPALVTGVAMAACALAAPACTPRRGDVVSATRAKTEALGAEAPAAVTCRGKRRDHGNQSITVDSGGRSRFSLLHVPRGYDPHHGTMLVLNFHGFLSDPWQERILTGMDAASEARGFIVAYPEGIGPFIARSWNGGDCCAFAKEKHVDDVGFVRDVIAEIENEYCIDPRRIYATGFSNGAFLTHRLACDMADTFAAVAPVSGFLARTAEQCQPSRPIPVLDFHGSSDGVVPMNGGIGLFGGDPFEPLSTTLATWRRSNGCSEASQTTFARGDTQCRAWSDCAPGGEVVSCVVDKGGHTWPGGFPFPIVGKTTFAIAATETMIRFFEDHPMPIGNELSGKAPASANSPP